MAVDTQSADVNIIRQLIPISTLPEQTFVRLCAYLTPEWAEKGHVLFKRGDYNSDFYYLLAGSINLCTETFSIEVISAGSDSAHFAIAHHVPRKVNAIASSRVRFLRVNVDMMKMFQEASYEENEQTMTVEELEYSDDWMTMLLKLPLFRSLPPANLQKLLMSLEEVRFVPGQVIIQQGDPGDYYYIIKKGEALITRKPAPNAKEIKLAKLQDMDAFGEDALISGGMRSTSITALTDIVLFRLGKDQFIQLIKQPTIKYIQVENLADQLDKGAMLIDVRGADEYKAYHLPNSINVPFFSLRMYLKTLNRHQPIIVVCKNGNISEVAAFILHQHRFAPLVLKNGVEGYLAKQPKSPPASFVIDDGTETVNLSASLSLHEKLEEPSVLGKESSENVDPNKEIERLKMCCNQLMAEKMALEKQCGDLKQQVAVLKAALEKSGG